LPKKPANRPCSTGPKKKHPGTQDERLFSRDRATADEGVYQIPDLILGVRDAKANLSWALREVKQGKEVVITEYGTPIARLLPARPLSLEERLAEMESRGEIEPATAPKMSITLPLDIPGDVALKLLEEGRK